MNYEIYLKQFYHKLNNINKLLKVSKIRPKMCVLSSSVVSDSLQLNGL